MKTLLLSIAVMLTTIGLNAQEKVLYSNVMETESGTIREYVSADPDTKMPLTKNTYIYDNNDVRLSKTSYNWDSQKGWIEYDKIEFHYIGSTPHSISYIKWDNQKQEWSNKQVYDVYMDSAILYTIAY